MFDTIVIVIFLTAGNAALWCLILYKRARRHFVSGLIRGNWMGSRVRKEDVASGELVVFCMAIVGEMAFALFTFAAVRELLRQ